MGLYALDRLADNHALAARIASYLSELAGVANVLPAETNIVIFDLKIDAPSVLDLEKQLLDDGVIIGAFGERRIRVFTHLDVDTASGDALCESLTRYLG